jgi:DNA-binding transcriptional regulator YhcF (GntR family)
MNNNNLKLGKTVSKRKYIVDCIIEDIQNGKIGIGSALPSLNELSEQFGVSYLTAVNAYRELMARGIIKSNPRKGYRVSVSKDIVDHRIFLLLDELNGYKKVLYESFKDGIGKHGTVDVFFHHFNTSVFENIITQNLANYTAFAVMPTLQRNCSSVLKTIPEGKLYILDYGLDHYGEKYPCVCQNFGKDIYEALSEGIDLLSRYNKLILVHLGGSEPDMIKGFHRFCAEKNIQNERLYNTLDREPVKGECYVVILDDDLVNIVRTVNESGLKLGKNIGVISYNDTPLKKVVANGITVISTDFRKMGLTMADMILKRKKDRVENPCHLIRRGSL